MKLIVVPLSYKKVFKKKSDKILKEYEVANNGNFFEKGCVSLLFRKKLIQYPK